MSVPVTAVHDDAVPPEIVSTVFYSAAVSDSMAILVVEIVAGSPRLTWVNDGAVQMLGYAPDDLRALPVEQLFPSLGSGEVKLLLRRERTVRMTLPVRAASGATVEALIVSTPAPTGRMWTLRLLATSNEQERALRATADAHERRFSTLTERSPVPTLLSEQGMRLAHVNDAFCTLVGRRAEQLLGTGWIDAVHPDDVDQVIEHVADALEGGDAETQARLVRDDGVVRTAIIRFAHLYTPGVGAGFVGTIEDITDRLAFETQLAHQANHDPLTGLPNRTLLAELRRRPVPPRRRAAWPASSSTWTTSRSSTTPSATPPATSCSSRWRAGCGRPCGPSDLVARFGGDEFVVVCEGVDETAAVALAERDRGWPWPSRCTWAGSTCGPTPASGSPCRPPSTPAPTTWSATATSRCTRPRPAARGGSPSSTSRPAPRPATSCAWSPSSATRSSAARSPSTTSRSSTPPTAARSRSSRWPAGCTPSAAPISPATFIPLAEESGLITALGMLVLDETCRQLAEWDRLLGDDAPPRANVNVSALQLDGNLAAQVADALAPARAGSRPASPSRSPSRR